MSRNYTKAPGTTPIYLSLVGATVCKLTWFLFKPCLSSFGQSNSSSSRDNGPSDWYFVAQMLGFWLIFLSPPAKVRIPPLNHLEIGWFLAKITGFVMVLDISSYNFHLGCFWAYSFTPKELPKIIATNESVYICIVGLGFEKQFRNRGHHHIAQQCKMCLRTCWKQVHAIALFFSRDSILEVKRGSKWNLHS